MKPHPLYLYALDPTHIGAGGYRMGRVDLTILRDAGTNLPKVPGSSISGATRSAAIHSLPEGDQQRAMDYARATISKKNKNHPHKGSQDPIASIFGYAEGGSDGGDDEAKGESRIGVVSFRDAEILAFPVPTMLGPRWVTTAHLLERAVCGNVPRPASEEQVIVQAGAAAPARLNLGWLLLSAAAKEIPFPKPAQGLPVFDHLKERLVVVHDNLFPAIVNSNLETRTSVSINFETGAAADTALFTYEATPRGTLFRGQIDLDDGRFPPEIITAAMPLLEKALTLACTLGLGGMTTRGFGRMQFALVK
ncbi:MAG TPA: RAMP superfamily CRISPR-associated protein [Accumulibacter sp.]|uniref:RAMP superfamily CRISPR-associated protein n=1 Tax=Accumulibacter sp. TaxID=2053492 RepID=UPI002CA1AE68|nr:RAMP superfamily CRISPR-associated protein [Accumulibacter sp.]HRD88618.1 RAMP superfamily CRISPR-associated protein [Accumulibacter sp.]